jgi:acetoin:2,6-dichlorophenolindophenol oxidoreductase subunit beta
VPGFTFLEGLRAGLLQVMEMDPNVVLLGEDILDPYGGAFKATKGLSTKFPDRVFTTPISEAAIAGVAVGMALRGMRPIAEFMFGDFITLAADQIVNHAAKYVGMYSDQIKLSMVLRTPVGGGRGYGPTHSQSLEKMFLGLPMFHILAPSHFVHPGEILAQAISGDYPTLFLENKLLYPELLEIETHMGALTRTVSFDQHDYPVVMLSNFQDNRKADIAVITYGGNSRLVGPILKQLAEEEIWITACLPVCLSPSPSNIIQEMTEGIGKIVVIEEGSPLFGWSSEITAALYDVHAGKLDGPILRIGAENSVIPASKPLEEKVLVSKEKIMSAMVEVMGW